MISIGETVRAVGLGLSKIGSIANIVGHSSFIPHVWDRLRLNTEKENREYFSFLERVHKLPPGRFKDYAGETIAIPHREPGSRDLKGYGIFAVPSDARFLIGKTYLEPRMRINRQTIVVDVFS